MHFWGISDIFSLDMSQISCNLLKKTFATWQYAFLSNSVRLYDIFPRACAETCDFRIFGLFYFFSPFLFSPFLIFLLQWLAFYWACFQFKNSREITIETENSYHGVAKCSWGKLCSEFFAQTSEHFRAYFWINGLETSDLLSLERSFPPAEFEYCISDANFGQTRWRQ